MASELRVVHRPRLERPVMIAAFRGWNDGGQGASLAGGYLAREWQAERFADIDPENFYDFQATRPMCHARGRRDAHDRVAGERVLFRAPARAGPRRDPAARRRAEPALADVLQPDRRLRQGARRRDGRSRSVRCSPTSRTRARARSPAARPTASSSTSSASRPRATKARPASSACCTTRATEAGIPSVEPVGRRPALRAVDAEPARRAGAVRAAGHAARRPHRRHRSSAAPAAATSSR